MSHPENICFFIHSASILEAADIFFFSPTDSDDVLVLKHE